MRNIERRNRSRGRERADKIYPRNADPQERKKTRRGNQRERGKTSDSLLKDERRGKWLAEAMRKRSPEGRG